MAIGKSKHASWWGKWVDDNDCAGEEDSGWGFDDCFVDDWETDGLNGLGTFLPFFARDNIGEPPSRNGPAARPGSTPLDGQPEFWFNTPITGRFLFCGFLCPPSDPVTIDGGCERSVEVTPGNDVAFPGWPPNFTGLAWPTCAASLEEKLDTDATSIAPAQTSSGLSGTNSCSGRRCDDLSSVDTGRCNCDDSCHFFNDCCPDKVSVCGDYDNQSCRNKCGNDYSDYTGICSCSANCVARGDCCNDIDTECPGVKNNPTKNSCEGRCGQEAHGGVDCACDHLCGKRQDCCTDKETFCPLQIETKVGSCDGHCAPYFGAAYSGGCHCDPGCVQRGDCCDDAVSVCNVFIHENYTDPGLLTETPEQRLCRFKPGECRFYKIRYDANVAYP